MAIVLLIDQDPSVRGVLTKALARFGHDALTASNAAEALQALGANHIDLVICDWSMSAASAGQLDGLELLRQLREEDRDVPVIMLTEFGTIEHAVSAMRAGATHYLAKPFQNEQLQLTIDQALAVARLRDENRALLREPQGRRVEFESIGGAGAVKVDVRIIATTSRNLEQEVNAGRFRQDLFYRLNVFPISIPPLRDRREDIPSLAHRFAARAAEEAGKEITGLE